MNNKNYLKFFKNIIPMTSDCFEVEKVPNVISDDLESRDFGKFSSTKSSAALVILKSVSDQK